LPLELPDSLAAAGPTSMQQLAYPSSELLSRQQVSARLRPPGLEHTCTYWRHWACYSSH